MQQALDESGEQKASLGDILRFSRPEWPQIGVGLLLSLLRGVCWPLFSVFYGRLFLVFSAGLGDQDVQEKASHSSSFHSNVVHNSVAFALLGFFGGLTTFGSASLLGVVGEKVTQRLRLAVFKVLFKF
jgi:ATP-binding cassette subfamily B (MDR/TAP) protein 1